MVKLLHRPTVCTVTTVTYWNWDLAIKNWVLGSFLSFLTFVISPRAALVCLGCDWFIDFFRLMPASSWMARTPALDPPLEGPLLVETRGIFLFYFNKFQNSLHFLLNFAQKFWMASLFCLKGAKEKVLSRKKALHFQRTFGHHFYELCQCSSDFLQVLAMFTSVTVALQR